MNVSRAIRYMNAALYRKGVRQPLIRRVLIVQILSSAACILAGCILLPATSWVFWLGISAAVSTWSFFSLTKMIPQFILSRYTPSVGFMLFLRMQGRLLAIVAVGCAFAFWGGAPVGALLAGFSLTLVGILCGILLSLPEQRRS